MPRPRSKPGEIPQIQFYPPRNLACIYIEGKRYYLGPWRSPEVEENRLHVWTEYQAKKKVHLGLGETVTVAILVDRFLGEAEKTYIKNGRQTCSVKRFVCTVRPLLELYARTPADQFGPLALKAVRNYIVETGYRRTQKNGEPGLQLFYCREKVNEKINLIRHIFKWGVENELVRPEALTALQAVAPLKRGRTTAHELPPIRPVRDDVVEKTIRHTSPVVGDMVRLQRMSGMRPGEVISMRYCDIYRDGSDFPPGYEFPPLGDLWVYIPEEHKTEHHGQTRFSFLGEKCRDLLESYMNAKKSTPEAVES